MNRQHVQSSTIVSAGYDPNTETMEIAFKSGGMYQYAGVPLPIYRAFRQAVSQGIYFHGHIKGKFETTKL